MLSKSQIKQLRLLHQKKYRDEQNLFIAEGPKIVNELLNSKYVLRELFALNEFHVSDSRYHVKEISEKELISISTLSTPNQVLGVFEMCKKDFSSFKVNGDTSLILALEDIRDPGNLGTIIRIADWFGISKVLCTETCVDVYSPKVLQATMGSIGRVEVIYANLESVLSEIKNQQSEINIYGAVMDGKNIYSEKLFDKGILLIGNESKGISENLLRFLTHKISIPNFGKADSLNAAIATAIICSEFKRV